ncbi:ROK family transcriptional regulator [Acetivibrio cellulolyticus]|uniref:ROK family transcriptional regulator n=1 Tax=Acetivibrio cellulolyticus TaxID=35830 RepID=UPI0001E2CC8A|nr:ROK family protein [Acetivibrio cellulolyticus]
MTISGNSLNLKYDEHKKIFNLIRYNDSVTKSKLVSLSGYKLSTLNRIINDLMSSGLVKIVDTGISTGGRKPLLYSIDLNAGYIIGVEITRMYTRLALMDMDCNILRAEAFGMFRDSTPEKTVKKISSLVSDFCKDIESSKILGIGIGAIGPLDHNKGVILNPANFPNDKWKNIPIKDMIEEHTKLPTLVENGVNAGAFGEYIKGSGKNFNNIAYITAGVGLRLGLVSNGKHVRNLNNYSGGFGHLKIDTAGPICYCGHSGCLETFVSVPAVLSAFKNEICKGRSSKALQKVEFDISAINLDTFLDAVESHDLLANEILENTASYMSKGLLAIENILAPDLIILGGPLFRKCDRLFHLTVNMTMKNIQKCSQPTIQFSKETLGENAVVTGVGGLLLDYYLK